MADADIEQLADAATPVVPLPGNTEVLARGNIASVHTRNMAEVLSYGVRFVDEDGEWSFADVRAKDVHPVPAAAPTGEPRCLACEVDPSMCRVHRSRRVPAAAPAGETGLDLAAVRARCDTATPGPWTAVLNGCEWRVQGKSGFGWYEPVVIADDDTENDEGNAEFIAHARTDLPALLDLAGRQRQEIQRLTVDQDSTANLLRNAVDAHIEAVAERDVLAARITAVEKLLDPKSEMAGGYLPGVRLFDERDIRAALRGGNGEATDGD